MGQVTRDGTKQIALMNEWQLLVAGKNDPRFHLDQSMEEAMQNSDFFMIVNDRGLWATQYQTRTDMHIGSLSVNDSNLALSAAEHNMCLLLTRWSIAANAIQAGRLKQVTRTLMKHDNSYQLVWPNRSNQAYKLVVFQEWLLKQCQEFEQYTATRIEQLNAS